MAGEKFDQPRDPQLLSQMKEAYEEKVKRNLTLGLLAFGNGEYTPFTHFSEVNRRTYDTILLFDENTKDHFDERVVRPLERLAKAHGIEAVYPGRGDGQVHTVLQPARFNNLTLEEISTRSAWLSSSNSGLDEISASLIGLTFYHNRLVLGAHTSYICTDKADDEQMRILRAREATAERMKYIGLTPVDYNDICHSSSMRLLAVASPNMLFPFAVEAYSTVGGSLMENPLRMTVSNVYRGMAIDYQRVYTPQFVRS